MLGLGARSRPLGAFDAGDIHLDGARRRRAARAVQKASGRDPSANQLYDRRGYNPEKAASFFATH